MLPRRRAAGHCMAPPSGVPANEPIVRLPRSRHLGGGRYWTQTVRVCQVSRLNLTTGVCTGAVWPGGDARAISRPVRGRNEGKAVDVGQGARVDSPQHPRRAGIEAANAPLSVCPWHPTATAGPQPPSPVPPPPAQGTVRNEGRRRAPPRRARAGSAASATHRRAAAAAAGRPFKSPGSFAWPRPPVTRLARAGPSPLPLGRSF